VCLGALLFAAAIAVPAGLRFGAGPGAATRAPAATWEARWSARAAALRHRLEVDPADERARLRLAGALITQARQEAQRAYPTERAATPADAAALETWSDEAVRRSPRLAEARRLAEGEAEHGRDRRQRAAAWVILATIERLEGNDEGGVACVANAAREDPSYREDIAFLKEHSR
jgi:hypothetical protein